MANDMILVTGAGGFLGNRLCSLLKTQGRNVLAQLLPGEDRPDCDECLVADIRSMDELQQFADLDIRGIYHLAGLASVPKSVENPRADMDVNLLGTFNMLELARKLSLEFFAFASTLSVLDPSNTLPLTEDSLVGPSAPYAAAKMAGEGYCRAYWRCYQVPTRVVRYGNIYGPGKLRKMVVHDLIGKLLRDPTRLEIFGDGQQIRDFLYVDDAAAGMQMVAEKGDPGELYHVGSGQPVSIRELIGVIISQLNLTDVEIVSARDTWKGDVLRWYADISKSQALGFEPETDLPAGIAHTIEWIRPDESPCQGGSRPR